MCDLEEDVLIKATHTEKTRRESQPAARLLYKFLLSELDQAKPLCSRIFFPQRPLFGAAHQTDK